MRNLTIQARRTITIFAVTLFFGGTAFAAFGVPDVAQDIARRTAEDAYNGNPYAMFLLVGVFFVAAFLWGVNQAAAAYDKIRGKVGAKASGPSCSDPSVIAKLKHIGEKVDRIEERTDELWDDMNRRKGREAAN